MIEKVASSAHALGRVVEIDVAESVAPGHDVVHVPGRVAVAGQAGGVGASSGQP